MIKSRDFQNLGANCKYQSTGSCLVVRAILPAVQKVPQTSVSPTYKLTLPADYVQLHLNHLVGQEIEVTDHSGAQFWDVIIQPRRNKDKYEYTLQVSMLFTLLQ